MVRCWSIGRILVTIPLVAAMTWVLAVPACGGSWP